MWPSGIEQVSKTTKGELEDLFMIFEGSTVLVQKCSGGGIPAEYILNAFALYNDMRISYDGVDLKEQGIFLGARGTHV